MFSQDKVYAISNSPTNQRAEERMTATQQTESETKQKQHWVDRLALVATTLSTDHEQNLYRMGSATKPVNLQFSQETSRPS